MTLNLLPIQGRKDFKAHDSSLLWRGKRDNGREQENGHLFRFLSIFNWEVGIEGGAGGSRKTQPNFSDERHTVRVLQLDNL